MADAFALPPGFWSKVDRSGGEGACWLWSRALDSDGYGMFRLGVRMGYAHRVVLQWATQKKGKGLEASHGPCREPACVNPAHLSWKTHKENMADRVRDGTTNRGERCHSHKLTEAKVLAIRADTRLQREIAADYKVSESTVGSIKTRYKWAWLK